MQLIWARNFEPLGISVDELQKVIETQTTIARFSDNSEISAAGPNSLHVFETKLQHLLTGTTSNKNSSM